MSTKKRKDAAQSVWRARGEREGAPSFARVNAVHELLKQANAAACRAYTSRVGLGVIPRRFFFT
jgi:hypothetical protein